jgi:gliding motility-associated-like protein
MDYTNIAFSGRESVSIRACDTDDNCTTQPFEIEIAGGILVYNAISPDGKNPVFRLEYIDLFPDTQKNTVYIYNRWGDEVFSATDYDNVTSVFSGLSSNGNKLPSGTYFYKVLFASGRKTMTGYLELRY